jgi:hypothetical protein
MEDMLLFPEHNILKKYKTNCQSQTGIYLIDGLWFYNEDNFSFKK